MQPPGMTPLQALVEADGPGDLVEPMVKAGMDPNELDLDRDRMWNCIVAAVVLHANVDLLSALLRMGGNANWLLKDETMYGYPSPRHNGNPGYADPCFRGYPLLSLVPQTNAPVDTARVLVEFGADVTKTSFGDSIVTLCM